MTEELVWQDWATIILMSVGVFFALTGSLGLLRMPDFYSRLHPAGKSDTLAQALILGGAMFQAEDPLITAKLLLICLLLFVTAPTATHAITKAATKEEKPWTRDGGGS
jgi:multicomponent Na+:H+ antiporter subunit G